MLIEKAEKEDLEEIYEEFQKGAMLKAVDDGGVIIGSVRAYQDNGTAYIGKLMVHPSKQGQGIGTQLLLAMEKLYPDQRDESPALSARAFSSAVNAPPGRFFDNRIFSLLVSGMGNAWMASPAGNICFCTFYQA